MTTRLIVVRPSSTLRPACSSDFAEAFDRRSPQLALVTCIACARDGDGQYPVGGITLADHRTVERRSSMIVAGGDPRGCSCVETEGADTRVRMGGPCLELSFIDMTERVGFGGRGGLLSVASIPTTHNNGFLFGNTPTVEATRQIERYT